MAQIAIKIEKNSYTFLKVRQTYNKMCSKSCSSCCPSSGSSSKCSTRSASPEPREEIPDAKIPEAKAIPAFLDAFLSDPRTTNLKFVHKTQMHVAILMKRGKIISHATNRVGSRSRGVGFSDKTIHAERNCVRQLGDISQLRGAQMYIMRISKDATNPEFMSSKPCHECEVFLEKCVRKYGLRQIFYTA